MCNKTKKNPLELEGGRSWIYVFYNCIMMIFPKMLHIVSNSSYTIMNCFFQFDLHEMGKKQRKKQQILWLHSVFDIFFKAPEKNVDK